MQYVYGPVPSRRLGKSLGIDPIPFKTCNWNCVYCQLGRTSPVLNQRREYAPAEAIVEQVGRAVDQHSAGQIDWLTFVGSGEPTLHSRLGWMLGQLKSRLALPVAVITNGSLLSSPDVRAELLPADAVLPSLDAGSEEVYWKLNRPHSALRYDQHVEGLRRFAADYAGRFWVEVMLVRGLNDTPEALADLARVLQRIGPDEIHLNLPIRPPCEPWVEPPDAEGIMRAVSVLGSLARVVQPRSGEFDLSGIDDVVEAVLAVVTRHPMRETELIETLARWSPGELAQALDRLRDSGRLQVVTRFGLRFWSTAAARYVRPVLSRCRPTGQPPPDRDGQGTADVGEGGGPTSG